MQHLNTHYYTPVLQQKSSNACMINHGKILAYMHIAWQLFMWSYSRYFNWNRMCIVWYVVGLLKFSALDLVQLFPSGYRDLAEWCFHVCFIVCLLERCYLLDPTIVDLARTNVRRHSPTGITVPILYLDNANKKTCALEKITDNKHKECTARNWYILVLMC